MELSIASIIKLILGLLVVVAVAFGLYRLFSSSISNSFSGIELNASLDIFLSLL